MRLLFMLIAFTISILTIGQTNKSIQVRYNGFYQTISEIDKGDNDTTWNYLKFYPNGKVISVNSEGTAYDLKDWFNLKMDNPSIGNYEIIGRRLNFSTTSIAGTVIYHGKMNDQYHLSLKSKSLINGYKVREKYYFEKILDLR